jgi:hypothetical protein
MPCNLNTDPLDELLDTVCELPHAIEEVHNALQVSETPSECAVKRLLEVLEQTYTWQFRLRQSAKTPLYTAKPAQLTNPADERDVGQLFPFALEFRSLRIGTYFVLSWGIQLQINATLLHVPEATLQRLRGIAPWPESSLSSSTDSLHMSSKPTVKDEADRIARLLCQTVEYCHRPEMGIFGPQTMLYTQWSMRSYFQQVGSERELAWCLNVSKMRGRPTRCSIKTMSFQGEQRDHEAI